ncbi:MAG: spore germination protein [Clostridia bacterium]|nr:spore germination protein [Clostridia bacterium]
MKVFSELEKNIKIVKKRAASDDVEFVDVLMGKTKGVLIYVKDLVNKDKIGDLIIRPLYKLKGTPDKKTIEDCLLCPEKDSETEIDSVISAIVSGKAVLFTDGLKSAFTFGIEKFEKRSITEPPTSTVIKGPREGFVESLSVNVSLLRRRLRTEKLKFFNIKRGKYSSTVISVCYIDGVADPKLVKKIKDKIKNISIDAVLDSSYVSKFLCEHKTSVFRQTGTTEKPDILAAKILEGRVAVFVDGSPIAITLPYVLMEDFQSPSDYYFLPYNATFARIIRLFSVSIALLLPAIFVSAELFHLQLIPLSFLLTIVGSIKGIPLSPSLEMFVTLLIFEILNETSVRMPRYVGMVVSIVGGLVLGETAVTAGIISAPTLMIIAFSGICLFTVPELEKTFSVIRLLFLLVAGSVGAYGLLAAVAFFIIYLISFESYQTPLLAPFSPLITKDLKDGFYKGFIFEQKYLPQSIVNGRRKRLFDKKENK